MYLQSVSVARNRQQTSEICHSQVAATAHGGRLSQPVQPVISMSRLGRAVLCVPSLLGICEPELLLPIQSSTLVLGFRNPDAYPLSSVTSIPLQPPESNAPIHAPSFSTSKIPSMTWYMNGDRITLVGDSFHLDCMCHLYPSIPAR